MLFNSLTFALFAPSFFVIYFSTSGRQRLLFTLCSSYFFYGWWDWRFVSLLMYSTLVDFYLGREIAATEDKRIRLRYLLISLVSNLGVLGFFKYFNFFADSFVAVANAVGYSPSPLALSIILPVGISFYTFQTLSYTIDLYRRDLKPETDLLTFAAYVAMFPQLVAGPIVRAKTLLPQLHTSAQLDSKRIWQGLELMIWGFFLKLCLADNAATVVDPRFNSPDHYGALSHLVGVLAFSFQIYGDFAGYSLIAIGVGRIMGFDFGANFNRPYFARSFSDFWNRWHISLSSWLRDYLYIPLGGNRGNQIFTFRNLVITMALGGLWHGAGWNFVIWGLLHGLYLVLQRVLGDPFAKLMSLLRVPSSVSNLLLVFAVFTLTSFAWIFFRAETLSLALQIIEIIARMDGMTIGAGEQRIAITRLFMIVLVVLLFDKLSSIDSVKQWYGSRLPVRIVSMAAVVWLTLLFGSFAGTSFLYFQF